MPPTVARTRKFKTKAKTLDGQAQLRQRFVDAGKTLLKQAPDEEPSLRKVAEVTGYAPSALYRYFAAKADLMYAIREEYIDRSVAFARERTDGEPDAARRLLLGFEAMVLFWRDNPDEFRHVYSYRPRVVQTEVEPALLHDRASIEAARAFSVQLVRDFFLKHGVEPAEELLAQFTDTIIVATTGVVAIPLGSPSMSYCATEVMVRSTIQAFIVSWTAFIDFLRTLRLSHRPTAAQFDAYLQAVVKLV